MTNELVRCMTELRTEVEAISPRRWRVRDVKVRLLCTRCRYERNHPCWKVTLAHDPAVDFIIWVRMDQSNERLEQVYLISVADFADYQYIWPSTRTLQKYERYAYSGLRALFGLV